MENLKISLKIVLKSKDPKKDGSFGPGIVSLLKGVMKTGSLNQATKQMDMSYSKAWRIIRESEEMLGFKLIDRYSGSKGSGLTIEGIRLLEIYEEIRHSSELCAEEMYAKKMKSLGQ